MKKYNSILKNTSLLISGNLLQRGISFFTIIMITRYLGPAVYGKYNFVISLVTISAVFWNFGLNTVLTMEISVDHRKASRLIGQALIMKFFLFGIAFWIIYFYATILGYEVEVIAALILFSVGKFISSINETFSSVFISYRRMEYPSLLDVVRSLSVLIGIFFVVHYIDQHKLIFVFSAYVLAFLIVFMISLWFLTTQFVVPKLSIRKNDIKRLLDEAKPFVLIAATDIVLFRVDHLMLSKMAGDYELGYYGAAYTLFEIIISLFPMMIIKAAFPVLSDKFVNDINGFKKVSNILLKLFLYLSIPMSCGLFLIGSDVCIAVYGLDYAASGRLLTVLGGAIWLFFLIFFFSWELTAMRMQKLILKITFITMLLNIFGNAILIPAFGVMGAASVTIGCEVFRLFFLIKSFRKNISIDYNLKLCGILCSSSIMSVIIYVLLIFRTWDHLIFKISVISFLGALVYFSMSSFFKVIQKQDILMIRKS